MLSCTADLAANEFVPTGIKRIEAVYQSRIPDLTKAPVPGIVVAVVDTGVDSTHPDLNVVGGMNFVADEPQMTYSNDSHGHGTHVAGWWGWAQGSGLEFARPRVQDAEVAHPKFLRGLSSGPVQSAIPCCIVHTCDANPTLSLNAPWYTSQPHKNHDVMVKYSQKASCCCCCLIAGTIGAINQGRGIVGVAPGIGIYALRVLKADGNGLFSDLLRAYDHLVANARRLGIRVVNLSLSGSGNSGDEECTYIKQLVDQGITVVTAAGMQGSLLSATVWPTRRQPCSCSRGGMCCMRK